jgi:hypothetical protein
MISIARVAKQTQEKINGLLPELAKILDATQRHGKSNGKHPFAAFDGCQ